MKINIISVGKLAKNYRTIFNHYLQMMKWKINEKELIYNKKISENQIKSYEAKIISAQLKPSSFIIIFDITGKSIDSEEYSKLFAKQMMLGKNIDIVIGGAFGLDLQLIKQADIVLSLSKMTFPHQLAKIIIIEQIYRAQTMLDKHPYHK